MRVLAAVAVRFKSEVPAFVLISMFLIPVFLIGVGATVIFVFKVMPSH